MKNPASCGKPTYELLTSGTSHFLSLCVAVCISGGVLIENPSKCFRMCFLNGIRPAIHTLKCQTVHKAGLQDSCDGAFLDAQSAGESALQFRR